MAKENEKLVSFRMKPTQFGGPGTYETKVGEVKTKFIQKRVYSATTKQFDVLKRSGYFELVSYVDDGEAVGEAVGGVNKTEENVATGNSGGAAAGAGSTAQPVSGGAAAGAAQV